MKGDVALAGIVFSADDWAAYEPVVRAELEEVDTLPTTVRGDGGFGSTGR